MGLPLHPRLIYFFAIPFFFVSSADTSWAQAQPRITEAIDDNDRVTLSGNVPPLARAEFDRGSLGSGQPMTRMLLLLKRSNAQEAALLSLMEQQQDKSSPNYHAWLTPETFGANYGPADRDIQAIAGWLSSEGFSIEKVYTGKTVIEFSGNAGQVQKAFGVEIHKFEVAGRSYVANVQNPQIPAALAPVVAGIVSLNNFPRASHARILGVARRIPGKVGLQPFFTFPSPNGNGKFYGLAPGDFATIYNSKSLIASGNDGTGQTIAIVGETNINVQDITNFRSTFGLPATFTASDVILNGEDPGITSEDEESEADLDVEWSGAVAPGATVKLVVSASTPASAGVDLSALYIIEHNLAGVMSESYGECEQNLGTAGNAFYNSLWEQAAAQGITAILSAGDAGSAGCDDFTAGKPATKGLAVSGMSSTPFNVSVGGTDFDQNSDPALYWSATNSLTGTSALGYIPEIPWNQNCAQIGLTGCGANAPSGWVNIVAGSGGPSTVYSKPTWQMGVAGMPSDGHRDQPDVSFFASAGFDGTGYIICQQDQTNSQTCNLTNDFLIIGGTSAAAPAFAGTMALVNQLQAKTGSNRQGNANHVLYALAKQSGASCASSASEAAGCVFNDVTKGNSDLPTGGVGVGTNSVACTGGTPNCSAAVSTANGVLVDPAHPTTEAWTAAAGYDMTTGLGTMNIGNLVARWGSVSTVATTTTLALTPLTGITHGTNENVSVNITVKPTTGTATGDVSLIANLNGATQGLDQFTLAGGSIKGQETQSLPGGSYSVYAHYAGDGTNAPSDSAPVAVSVGQESSQTFIVVPTFDSNGNQANGNATSVAYGSNYILRMYVTDKNAIASPTGPPSPNCYQEYVQESPLGCPTGTVTLTANGAAVDGGSYTLNNAGYTRDISPSLTGGTYALVAQYSGDNSFQQSKSTTTPLTVTPARTEIQLTYSQPTILLGQPAQLQATMNSAVSASAIAPTGSVTFYAGTTLLPGGVSLGVGGVGNPGTLYANITTTFSTPGQQSITAKYSGDTNYAASTSSSTNINVYIPVAMVQSESSTNINYGQSITVTAKVTANSKTPPLTGQVQLSGQYASFTSVTTTTGTDANGNQTLTTTGTTIPQASGYIYAYYPGDSNYASFATTGDLVTVTIPDFTLGPANGVSVVPVAGQPGSGQITVAPAAAGQPSSTVMLSISSLVISGYTIAMSPQQVSLNGAPVPVTISMTPTSTAPTSAIQHQTRHGGLPAFKRGDWWRMTLMMGVVLFFLLGIRGRRRKFREAFVLGAVSLLLFFLGCGGGGGGAGGGTGVGGVATGGASLGPTTITLAPTNAKVAQNVPFTITATITSSKPLTGTVNFYNYGSPVNGGIPPTNGQAMTGSSYLNNLGLYQITATYSGDANNLPSSSAPLTQVITGTMPATIQGATGSDLHSLQVNLGVQ